MDTDALRWFQQVADGMTVTEVSELEQLTQSGVSRALARLEDQVGVALLYRSGRTLRMTHAGAVFKRHVDAMLHNLDDGVAALSQLLDPDTGTVVLAFQHSLGTWLIPDLVRGFRTGHPGVRFELHQVRDELGSPVLYGGRADLEISSRPEPDPDVRHRAIALEPLRLATSRDHPLADRASVGLAEVADEPFIGLRPRSALRKLTDELCLRAGFSPVVIFEGEDLATVRGFVAAGLGVAVVPAPRAGSAEAALSYIPIEDPGAVREISLTWSGERRLLPAAERFRVYVLTRAAAGRLPALDLLPKRREDPVDVSADPLAGDVPRHPGHQQIVVIGVLMPDRGDDRERHGLLVKPPASGRPADPATAAEPGVAGDRIGPRGRAPGEQPRDLGGELPLEDHVLVGAAHGVPLPAPCPQVRVAKALLFGLLDGGRLGQDALPLIALAALAPLHHDGGQPAGLLRPAGQRGVPGRQELKVVHISAGQAERTSFVHDQEVAGALAFRALPVPHRDDDHQIGRSGQLLLLPGRDGG
jgi:LysR family transcriptional regulator, transcription activator of glutamate synthase operon